MSIGVSMGIWNVETISKLAWKLILGESCQFTNGFHISNPHGYTIDIKKWSFSFMLIYIQMSWLSTQKVAEVTNTVSFE